MTYLRISKSNNNEICMGTSTLKKKKTKLDENLTKLEISRTFIRQKKFKHPISFFLLAIFSP